MPTIDLNADLGESFAGVPAGDDAAMLDVVSSANIACGFHSGDPTGILATCREAAARKTAIGAHIGYRDLAGFGRRFIDCDPAELRAEAIYQIGALSALASSVGAQVSYIKPHGALYNAIVHHEAQARAVVEAAEAAGGLPLLLLPGSIAADFAASAGVPVVFEAFADRGYRPDGTLVPRREPGAVLEDAEAIAARVVDLAVRGEITAVDGTRVPVSAASICLHGDSPGAVASARRAAAALREAGVGLAPFSGLAAGAPS